VSAFRYELKNDVDSMFVWIKNDDDTALTYDDCMRLHRLMTEGASPFGHDHRIYRSDDGEASWVRCAIDGEKW
jgi:hypothetical protein